MKKKVLALTLTAALALSSTSAFAATTNYTKANYNDINILINKFISNYANSGINYKVTVNGKTVDLNSINWKTLLNNNTAKTVAQKPAATQPVVQKPAVTQPAPVKPAPAPAKPAPAPAKPAPAPAPAKQAPAPAPVPAPVESTNTAVSSYEQKVVELVNVERTKAGLPALKLDTAMSDIARMKSKDMADNNYFAHQSPTYGSAGDMLTKFGIRWSAWGENLASGQRTPEAVVTAWMNSSGHRANIMSTNFSRIGVGYVTNANGTPYWTQMFAN
ncbi:MAG: CAP domain-containing protein [Sedimentibacter sp.]